MPLTPEEREELDALNNELADVDYYSAMTSDITEEEEDTGFFSNVARGMGERATDLGAGLAGAAEDIREGITDIVGGDIRVGYNLRGEDSGFDVGYFSKEEIEGQDTVFNSIDEALSDVDLGYEERYTLERMKEDPSVSTIAGFGMETLGRSMVDMAAMYASLPLYFTSRENEMAEERAQADNRKDPTFGDYAAVAPGNAVATLMDKWSFGKLISTKGAKDIVKEAGTGSLTKEVGKRILRESATEGLVQEPAEYLATHVGTETGVVEDELKDVMLGGAVGGAFGGGVIGTPAAVIERKAIREQRRAEEKAKADAAVAEKMAKVDEANAMNAQILADSQEMEVEANDIALARRQEEQLAKTQAASAEYMQATPETVVDTTPVVEEVVEEVIDVTPEFQTEETTVKRDKEDITTTVVDNKIKRKQARAERVLDNPTSTDEQIDRAEELLIEAQEDASIATAKVAEQKVKRIKEDKVTTKEGFLSKVPTVNGVKKKSAAETRTIAESLDIPTINDKGKKIPASTLKKAINEHPEVVQAREVTPAVSGKEVQDAKVTSGGVKYTPEEVAEQATVEAAFKPLPREEVVETPVEDTAPVKQATPTPTITEEEKSVYEPTLASDGVTIEKFNEDTMQMEPVDLSTKGRARFFKKIGKEDPELLTEGDRGLTDLQKAEKRLRSLEYQDQAQTEQGGLTPKQVEEKDRLVAKIEKMKKDEVEAVAKKAAEETVRVEQEKTTAPEGTTVEGQAEVDVVEATVDEEAAPDIEVEEAPTPETALAASIKAMIQQEVATQTTPTVTKEEMVEEDIPTLTERQEEQLDGWSRAGVDEDIIEMAEQNTELLTAVDVLTAQYKKEGMAGRDAFLKAVDEVTGGKEAMPEWATPTAAETTVAEEKTTKKEYIKTEEEAKAELVEAFGSSFTNIEFVQGKHPSGRNVLGTYYDGTGKIKVWFENVPKGDMAELILHEKGVHEMLAQDPNLAMEYQSILDRMEMLLAEGNTEVTEARDQATKAYNNKYGEDSTGTKRDAIIAEETVAYLMNSGENKGWFRRFTAQVRQTFKNWFSVDLQPDDLRILVRGIVEAQAQTEIDTKAQIEEGTGTEVTVDEEYQPTAEELAMFGMESVATDYMGSPMKEAVTDDINASENKSYQGTVAKDPRSFFQRVWDVSQTEGAFEAAKWGTRHLKDAPLKAWVPQSHLLRQARELGLEGIGELEAVSDKARQEAQENIDYAITNVVKPARTLAQSDRKEYLKVVQMLWDATYNNKDLKKSADFKRLTPEAQEVYTQVEAHYKKQGFIMLESMEAALTSDGISEAHKKELQGYIDTFRHTLNNTVYFPMQRFGARRITAYNEKLGRHVEFMDHTSEILEAKKELMKQGYEESDIKISMVESLERDAKDSMDRETFDRAQTIIRNMEGSKEAQEALWKTFMAMAPSNKLKDRMAKRRFVKGASNRMVEGLNRSTSMFFEASQRKHSPERSAMLLQAEKELDSLPQTTPEEVRMHKKAEEVLKEVKEREQMIGQTRAKWSSNLSKANFFIHLGFNMSSAIVNLTQNVIVGVPVLAAKHNAGKVAIEMGKQFANATKILGGNMPFETDSAQYKAFKDLESRGAINLTQAQMLQDISESDRSMIKDGTVENVMEASAWMFHKAEVANRITAAMASFNLNYDGSNYDAAVEQAIKDTREIHFDYSEEGKSRIQRGDIGGVALAFKSYPIQMAWYMASNIKKSMWFTDGTTEEKKAARTKIVGTLLMTQLFAGAMGMPMSSVLHFIADMIMEDEDDAHEMFKEFLRDNLGHELGDAIRMGVVGQLTGANLSSRTSLDQMFFRIPQGEARATDWSKSLMEASIGPIGARLTTIPKGVDLMMEGKALAGMEAFMPAIYTNMSRATRWGAEGQANNAYDDLVEKDFSTYDAILKGIGFTSSEYQDTSEDLWMGKRRDNTISRKKRIALRDMAISVIQGDSGDRREARKAIREWNRVHPNEKISQSTIKRRVRDLRKKLRGEE